MAEDGIEIFSNAEQPEKALSFIFLVEDGIEISVNDEHLQKAYSSISTTEEGITNDNCVNEEHP